MRLISKYFPKTIFFYHSYWYDFKQIKEHTVLVIDFYKYGGSEKNRLSRVLPGVFWSVTAHKSALGCHLHFTWKQDVLLIAPLPNHWFGNSVFPRYISIVVNSFSFGYDFQFEVEIVRMTASVWHDCAECRPHKIMFTRWSKFATTDFVDRIVFIL